MKRLVKPTLNKNQYKCPHCKKVVDRESEKKWIGSYCETKDQYVRLQLVKSE